MKNSIIVFIVFCILMSISVAFADVIMPDMDPDKHGARFTYYYKPSASDLRLAPIMSKLEIHNDNENNVWLEVTISTPSRVMDAIHYFENHEKGFNQAGYIGGLELQFSIDGKDYEVSSLNYSPNYNQNNDNWNGIFETEYLSELHIDSYIKAKARYVGADENGNSRYSDWSNEEVINEKIDFKASDWAKKEIEEADKLKLIPNALKNADLTKSITREEFAGVSVKAYEALTGNIASLPTSNPFKDTQNQDVLKAFKLGITTGTSDTTFEPDKLLNREQAATMLTRTYKKATVKGWTITSDDKFPLEYTKTNTFADDINISPWAKDSVYFMNANGIINGVGDNKFAPKNITSAEEAVGYANATREQAIIIATRMVKNLK